MFLDDVALAIPFFVVITLAANVIDAVAQGQVAAIGELSDPGHRHHVAVIRRLRPRMKSRMDSPRARTDAASPTGSLP